RRRHDRVLPRGAHHPDALVVRSKHQEPLERHFQRLFLVTREEPDVSISFDLTGKTAIVTGANTGSGQAIAVALARAGADVALVGRSSMAETEDAIGAARGGRCHTIKADLSTIEPVQDVVDQAVSWSGRADILVNNAGIIRRADAVDFTEADWDAVMDVNLKTVFFLSQAFARHVIAEDRPGKIINIASLLSF